MNHRRILTIFVILLLLAIIPLPFTAGEQTYLFGWLPLALAYWWVLMLVNLGFVLWVCRKFVKSSQEDAEKKEKEEENNG